MKRGLRTATIALCLIAGGFIALAACSNQGEGERCDSLNGDEDCKTDEDLACYPAGLLTGTASDRCCPKDRTRATHPVCKTPVAVVGTDGGAPPDTGPPSTPDASVQGPNEAAAPDADIHDASNDG